MIRAGLFLIGGIVVANIVWATFFWRAPAQGSAGARPAPVVNSATAQGQEPWMANERYNAPGRDKARKSMLQALDQPWSNFCSAEGRKLLIDAINHYYWQRHAQIQSYANTYGEAARQYAVKAWVSTDENRIERKTREIFGQGYFKLDELRPHARTPVVELVKGERISGKRCAG
jgi:hypothetical protein